ncbi:DUF4385 domain-containing protein [Cytophagaceae bacterium YF14B1]|uniref:DUF4385 domain-containing protein n=1 Tax=Xanthocytophaga flava TaxID=3048013 RepID=A0AAE3U849_9BACT|nr:DUF4385 domain-containing protein [Xanthocytophaga flavus]MDJ1482312.1 DUF4385 domain-containing protein [Xanthocytophaga flavus]
MEKKKTQAFDYSLDFKKTDFRQHPELYRPGVGEQGVLLVEPYKSEILPHWRFKTPAIAEDSAKKIFELFQQYLAQQDFVGADMARKFLQMGFTRARRYANYKGGRKYAQIQSKDTTILPYPYSSGSQYKGNPVNTRQSDADTNEKAQAAAIFKEYWTKAKSNPEYLHLRDIFLQKYT